MIKSVGKSRENDYEEGNEREIVGNCKKKYKKRGTGGEEWGKEIKTATRLREKKSYEVENKWEIVVNCKKKKEKVCRRRRVRKRH